MKLGSSFFFQSLKTKRLSSDSPLFKSEKILLLNLHQRVFLSKIAFDLFP